MPFVDGFINIILLLAVLVVLVLIHEFGHFIVARRVGVKVHEFGVGFPPRARVLHQGKETAYTLNWLPIGGFVRLEGEDGDSDDPRSFVRQPLRTRLVILLAGVIMNLLLAWVLMSAVRAADGDDDDLPPRTPALAGPASRAGPATDPGRRRPDVRLAADRPARPAPRSSTCASMPARRSC
jgi:regulator of sigma E protease